MSTAPGAQSTADHLEACAAVTRDVIARVTWDQYGDPTPCDGMAVAALLDHLVAVATRFADRAQGVTPLTELDAVTAGPDPAGAYGREVTRLVTGYRDGPAEAATPVAIAVIEAVCHGWDLAVATGQATPYPDDAVEAALGAAKGFMTPQFRGPGQSFGVEVPVPDSAPAVDRLVGFMGRDPGWKPPS
jgi:uncharacterized protein (TIGR03086 family)